MGQRQGYGWMQNLCGLDENWGRYGSVFFGDRLQMHAWDYKYMLGIAFLIKDEQ